MQWALSKNFGHDGFRQGQLEAIVLVVHGSDVFVRMATGSGKSLCMFLVPFSISDTAIGVIVSPLNGLMGEHVRMLLLFRPCVYVCILVLRL